MKGGVCHFLGARWGCEYLNQLLWCDVGTTVPGL